MKEKAADKSKKLSGGKCSCGSGGAKLKTPHYPDHEGHPPPLPVDSDQSQHFRLTTVQQSALEAMIDNAKKEMLQKQDVMLQAIRMELMQARPPLPLVRAPYSLPHSY